MSFPDLPRGSIHGRQLSPLDFEGKAEPYLVEIAPKKKLSAHFFTHKGEEMGYLLDGELKTVINNTAYSVQKGEIVYLKAEIPAEWSNPGPETAKLLWIKIK